MAERFSFAIFLLSLTLLAFAAGFFVAYRQLPPTSLFSQLYEDGLDLWRNWRHDFGVEPTLLLVQAPIVDAPSVSNFEPEQIMPGLRLISELTPGRQALAGLRLIDTDGAELHYWPVDYALLAPEGESPNRVFLHGIVPLEDGSIVVNFDNGAVLGRLDSCGSPMWVLEGNFHHVVSRSGRDTLWTWQAVPDFEEEERKSDREYLVEVDTETGQPIRRISLEDDVILPHGLQGRFAIRGEEAANRVDFGFDPFHPNDVEELSEGLAPAFPLFAPGDLLISLRSLNMVAVVEPETGQLKWSQIGPWHRQHDPDFVPDGTISVYDNAMGTGNSAILRVDPTTGEVWTTYEGDPPESFYSYRRGRHQVLENGNTLIVESERGRVLETAPDGELLWVYNNTFDAERNGLVNEAFAINYGFFTEGLPNCSLE